MINAKPLCLAIGKFDANRRLRTVYVEFGTRKRFRAKILLHAPEYRYYTVALEAGSTARQRVTVAI